MATASSVLEKLSASNIFDLRGVVAVVTGGGTGIGLMITTTLMANSATVYIVGPEQSQLDTIAKTYNDAAKGQAGRGRLVGLQGDISLKEEAKRLADEIGRRESHVIVLFNSTGVLDGGQHQHPLMLLESNARGIRQLAAYWMSAAFLPLLEAWKKSTGGSKFAPQIIMTSSLNGWTKDLNRRSERAIHNEQERCRSFHELPCARPASARIRVNGIAPGWFITNMTAPGTIDALGFSHVDPNETTRIPENKLPIFEIPTRQAPGTGVPILGGTNRDMATLALFLVANWYVNGETVLIDGGSI